MGTIERLKRAREIMRQPARAMRFRCIESNEIATAAEWSFALDDGCGHRAVRNGVYRGRFRNLTFDRLCDRGSCTYSDGHAGACNG